jgi:NAD(P)-dependent dehydrogenase (short-subunit alcohol dehydrogenase family)
MSKPREEAPFSCFTATWRTASYPTIEPSRAELSAAGKNVFITGGSEGIGAATAASFAQAGARHIGLLARTVGNLNATKQKLEQSYPNVVFSTCVADVASWTQVEEAFNAFAEAAGKIDVLISSAGVAHAPSMIKDAGLSGWTTSINTTILGGVHVLKAFLTHAAKDAVVINVTAGLSFINLPALSEYSTAKAASVTLFRCLQAEQPDMRVVSLSPGTVDTKLSRGQGIEKAPDDSECMNGEWWGLLTKTSSYAAIESDGVAC